MSQYHILDGILGECIGDALGVPVEFTSREFLETKPVDDMIGYQTHQQPSGTWSDDSSLMFCLAESLCHGLNYKDIAQRFCRWLSDGYWTPHGKVFDVGYATREAILRLAKGVNPIEAGGTLETDNGNGSLMRILPMAYYVNRQLERNKDYDIYEPIQNVSALTHAHPRSQIACSFYIVLCLELLEGYKKQEAYRRAKERIIEHYSKLEKYNVELSYFHRILNGDISEIDEHDIYSTGYVIDTLEASLWCFLQERTYKDTVLHAVNLGEDTDTTATVAGGLAGIYYGIKEIPTNWIEQLAQKEEIYALVNRMEENF